MKKKKNKKIKSQIQRGHKVLSGKAQHCLNKSGI